MLTFAIHFLQSAARLYRAEVDHWLLGKQVTRKQTRLEHETNYMSQINDRLFEVREKKKLLRLLTNCSAVKRGYERLG